MTQRRTTKSLASRIQIDYLTKRLPLRYWKRVLIITAAGVGIVFLGISFLGKNKRVYTPGPIATGHKMFAAECAQCHTQGWQAIPNQACLQCHTNLKHSEFQAFEPRCADCHTEHRGANLVFKIQETSCTTCHGQLKLSDGTAPKIAKQIRGLAQGHPEFRTLTTPPEPTALKLNHKVHMKPDLTGPNGTKVTLTCDHCHGVDQERDPNGFYRSAGFHYEKQCKECHELGFDRQFPTAVAPHKKPAEIREFLTQFYSAQSPTVEVSERTLPGPLGKRDIAPAGAAAKIASAERQLFGKTCLECHSWKYQPGSLPEVPKVVFQEKHLHNGLFDHAAHRPIACASCHEQAKSSEKSADVLIPSVKTCVECHTQNGTANSSCNECHRYHDRGREKIMEGTLPIHRIR